MTGSYTAKYQTIRNALQSLLFKKGSPSDMDNYWPIYLTHTHIACELLASGIKELSSAKYCYSIIFQFINMVFVSTPQAHNCLIGMLIFTLPL